MNAKSLSYVSLAALAAATPAIEVKAETGFERLSSLKADLNSNANLRAEYAANPTAVLARYGISPEIQVEALAENLGLTVAGNCICTGCCVTNVNT